MKVLRPGIVVAVTTILAILAAGVADSQVSAQSKKKASSSRTKSSKAKETKEDAAITGRLPRLYGQLDLEDAQRTGIYEIQANYREQIVELEEKLAALRKKMEDEVEGVLTATQKKTLSSLRAGTLTSSKKKTDDSSSSPREKSSTKKSSKKKKE